MCYLWIKENDAKTFKAFLSGNEIEVGLFVNPSYNAFDAGNQIEIFYGEENNDSYAAEIRKQEYLHPIKRSDKSYVRLSLKKV
jgi:hypothetical protein